MNIAKNMEAIFLLVLALVGATSVATAAAPARHAGAVPVDATVHVVNVVGHRLSAADKAAGAQ